MKPIFKLSLLFYVLLLCSCSQDKFSQDETVLAAPATTADIPQSMSQFKINESLLQSYLSLTHDKVKSVNPVVIDGDTLVYCLMTDEGWKVIASDERISPVMAQGKGEMPDINDLSDPNASMLQGQIDHVKGMRTSKDTVRNAIWEFLDPRVKIVKETKKKVKARGIGTGMWIAADTTYNTETTTHPHIITTSWHQSLPYNSFTPLVSSNGVLKHVPVGCVPVAAGQVLYHYRKNNHRSVPIPVSAVGPTASSPSYFSVTSSSADGWDNLGNSYYVAMFLRYLGLQMGTTYGLTGSSTTMGSMAYVLQDYYLLDFGYHGGYDYSLLMNSLNSSSPVIVRGTTSYNSSEGHAFIIDGYQTVDESLNIRYVWDPDHVITEEEYQLYDQSMFESSATDEDRVETVLNTEYTYITMNWGWTTSNSTWYIAHEYCNGYQGYDFAGYYEYPSRDETYSPRWATSNGTFISVTNMYYNFIEKTESTE